jgi:hypothetical protein
MNSQDAKLIALIITLWVADKSIQTLVDSVVLASETKAVVVWMVVPAMKISIKNVAVDPVIESISYVVVRASGSPSKTVFPLSCPLQTKNTMARRDVLLRFSICAIEQAPLGMATPVYARIINHQPNP